MRKLIVLVAFLIIACLKPGPGPQPPIAGTVIDCTVEGVKAAAVDALPAVATALASGDWQAELTKLVVKFGEAAIDCAVDRLVGEAEHDLKFAKGDGLAKTRAANGQAWLEQRQVKIASGLP